MIRYCDQCGRSLPRGGPGELVACAGCGHEQHLAAPAGTATADLPPTAAAAQPEVEAAPDPSAPLGIADQPPPMPGPPPLPPLPDLAPPPALEPPPDLGPLAGPPVAVDLGTLPPSVPPSIEPIASELGAAAEPEPEPPVVDEGASADPDPDPDALVSHLPPPPPRPMGNVALPGWSPTHPSIVPAPGSTDWGAPRRSGMRLRIQGKTVWTSGSTPRRPGSPNSWESGSVNPRKVIAIVAAIFFFLVVAPQSCGMHGLDGPPRRSFTTPGPTPVVPTTTSTTTTTTASTTTTTTTPVGPEAGGG